MQLGIIFIAAYLGKNISSNQILYTKYDSLLFIPPPPAKINIETQPSIIVRLRPHPSDYRPSLFSLAHPRLSAPPRPLLRPRRLVMKAPAPLLPHIALPQPQPAIQPVHFDNTMAAASAVHQPRLLRTGMFLGAPTTRHTLDPRRVQTGGFGSPAGARGPGRAHGHVMALGQFSLPEGAGRGNGQGGRRGAAGQVASIGFGSGMGAAGGGRPRGQVQGAGFGQTETAAAPQPRTAAETPPPTRAVVILFKPHPAYTAAARARHLEGDIWLSVIFLASGRVRVLRVVRGLGAGLDGSAMAAARSIRFRPARRRGQPVDFAARIRIRFRLVR